MMKQLLAIPLIFIMLVKPLWPVAEYIINYDYIVANLCENRDRPQLQCNGKCYLAKMFAENSADEHENPFGEERILELPLILNTLTTATIDTTYHEFNQAQVVIDSYSKLHSFLFVSKIVHPPEV